HHFGCLSAVTLGSWSNRANLGSLKTARTVDVKKDYRYLVTWERRRPVSMVRMRILEPTMTVVLLFVLVVPISKESPSIVMRKTEWAQQLIDELRTELAIDNKVQVSAVISHPFVFAVKPEDNERSHFVLSMEIGFLLMLDENELRAALAHE